MRRGLFDIGYESYAGRRGGGRPNDMLSGLGQLVGLGTSVADIVFSVDQAIAAFAGEMDPETKWAGMGGDMELGDTPANLTERLGILHNRLKILGIRRDVVAPTIFDFQMSLDISAFQQAMGMEDDGIVDLPTWAMLNYASALVNAGKADPIGAIPIMQAQGSVSAVQINQSNPGVGVSTVSSTSWGSLFSGLTNLLSAGAQAIVGAAATKAVQTVVQNETGSKLPIPGSTIGTTGTISPDQLNQNVANQVQKLNTITSLPPTLNQSGGVIPTKPPGTGTQLPPAPKPDNTVMYVIIAVAVVVAVSMLMRKR